MSDDDVQARTRQAIQAVWQANRAVYMARVAGLEAAAEAARSGALTPEAREAAADDAHKVAGAAGTFGFPEASRLAKAIEQLLNSDDPVDADRLQALTAELKQAFEG